MKNIIKAFGTGLLFVVASCCVYCFGTMAVEAFSAMPSAVGWAALGFTAVGLITGFLTLFTILCIGAIPLSAIEDLKSQLAAKEEDYLDTGVKK